ncbi:MAG: MFS transporter [Mycoplasmatales bacterium]
MSTKKLYFMNMCLGAMNAVALQMLPLILYDKQFNYSQVAFLLGLVYLSSFFIPLIGLINKRYLGDIGTFKLLMATFVLISIIMFESSTFVAMIGLVILFSLARVSIFPVNDSFLTKQVKQHKINYGFIKSGASMGFGIGMLSFTLLSNILHTNYNSAFVYMALLGFISFIIISTLPKDKIKPKELKNNLKTTNKTDYLKYSLLVLIYITYYGALGVRISYLSTYYVEFGYTTLFISITTFFMIIPEIIIMPFYNKLFGKFDKAKLIAIAITLGIIQILLYLVFYNNPLMLLITSLFNGFQIMLFFPSFFNLLQGSLSEHDATPGFLMNMTIQAVIVGFIMVLLIKPLYTHFESTIPVFWVIIGMMIISYIPVLIFYLKYPRYKNK